MNSPLTSHLDSPARIDEIRETIRKKPALRFFYTAVYRAYQNCIAASPLGGAILELGSGGGFAKEVIPEIITSDIIPYAGVDQVVDATRFPFPDRSLRAILMANVFHHIPDVSLFFDEARRCLVPGGRILIVDHQPGFWSSFLLKFIHHEPHHPHSADWAFKSEGPLSDANTALTKIVFVRDREVFEKRYPELKIQKMTPHSPLFYWLAGGLKPWSLIPGFAIGFFRTLDHWITRLTCGHAASYVNIEIRRE